MDLVGVGGIVTSVATVIDDLWVSEDEKMLAGAAQTTANAQLAAAQGQAAAALAESQRLAQKSADDNRLAAENSAKQWQTIQYGLLGAGGLAVLFIAYKAAQG